MQFFKTPNINFMKYKFVALAVTGTVILAGALNIFLGKGLKMGVDFGGALIRVIFKTPTATGDIRSELSKAGLGESVIQESGEPKREYLIRTLQVLSAADSQKELEAHQELANKVVEALHGDDGKAEQAQGLKDLNTIDHAGLTAVLKPLLGDKAEDAFRQSMIFSKGSLGIFWTNSTLVACIMTIAMVLLFWPLIGKLIGRLRKTV